MIDKIKEIYFDLYDSVTETVEDHPFLGGITVLLCFLLSAVFATFFIIFMANVLSKEIALYAVCGLLGMCMSYIFIKIMKTFLIKRGVVDKRDFI